MKAILKILPLLAILGLSSSFRLLRQADDCQNRDDFDKFPNREDCRQFFQCYRGESHLIVCPHGTFYNDAISDCQDQLDTTLCELPIDVPEVDDNEIDVDDSSIPPSIDDPINGDPEAPGPEEEIQEEDELQGEPGGPGPGSEEQENNDQEAPGPEDGDHEENEPENPGPEDEQPDSSLEDENLPEGESSDGNEPGEGSDDLGPDGETPEVEAPEEFDPAPEGEAPEVDNQPDNDVLEGTGPIDDMPIPDQPEDTVPEGVGPPVPETHNEPATLSDVPNDLRAMLRQLFPITK